MLQFIRKHNINIIMSNFNSRLGKGRFEDLVSLFELGTKKERTSHAFCQEEDMKVTNTFTT